MKTIYLAYPPGARRWEPLSVFAGGVSPTQAIFIGCIFPSPSKGRSRRRVWEWRNTPYPTLPAALSAANRYANRPGIDLEAEAGQ